MFIRWAIFGFLCDISKRIRLNDYSSQYSQKKHRSYSDIENMLHTLMPTSEEPNFVKQIKLNETEFFFGGFDGRYNASNEVILDIHKFRRQMDLLVYLESSRISQPDKIARIELYNKLEGRSKYVGNITNGGLFNDWLTEIK